METIEYKQLSLNFRKGLKDLVSDVEDVEHGEIPEEERQDVIRKATSKLEEYDGLVISLEDHFSDRLKNTVGLGEKMEYIRNLLVKISEK